MLDAKSIERLKGVHPDLVKVVLRAADLTMQPFTVTEGVRTVERERTLIAKGMLALSQANNLQLLVANSSGSSQSLTGTVYVTCELLGAY